MDWFMHHPVLLGLVGAGVAVGYGIYLTWWLLKQPAGNERMQEISRAVQEGASAYLTRQFRTLSVFAVIAFGVLFLLPADSVKERIGRATEGKKNAFV